MSKKKWRISYNAPAVLTFVLICLIATVLNHLTGGNSNRLVFSTYHSSLLSPLTWLRFFTHVFGHISWEHFMGNAIYLLLLGPMLEEKYGSSLMLFVIGATAAVTGVVNYIFFPYVALCGASGVCFAFILLVSFTSFREGEVPLTFILIAVIFIGQQVLEGLLVQDNISNLSHIIGGVIGAGIGYLMNKSDKYGRSYL